MPGKRDPRCSHLFLSSMKFLRQLAVTVAQFLTAITQLSKRLRSIRQTVTREVRRVDSTQPFFVPVCAELLQTLSKLVTQLIAFFVGFVDGFLYLCNPVSLIDERLQSRSVAMEQRIDLDFPALVDKLFRFCQQCVASPANLCQFLFDILQIGQTACRKVWQIW